MERFEFLKLIGSTGGSVLFGGSNFTKDHLGYTLQKIKIYDNYVRGVDFRKKDFFSLIISVGDEAVLVREVENKYDSFAVQVRVENKHIGYIAAYENIVLANLLDRGVTLSATISKLNSFEKGQYLNDIVSISVFAELMIPITHLNFTELTNKPADDLSDRYRRGNLII